MLNFKSVEKEEWFQTKISMREDKIKSGNQFSRKRINSTENL